MIRLRPILLAAACAALALPAVAQEGSAPAAMASPAPPAGLTIPISAQNNSGETGTATITDVDGGVLVKVSITGEPSGASQPTHIHQGTCAKLNPVPYKPLTDTVDGASVTTVKGITVAQLKNGAYAINVHLSAADLGHYVACGNL
jgi:Cu/Zn superoxide dismutase